MSFDIFAFEKQDDIKTTQDALLLMYKFTEYAEQKDYDSLTGCSASIAEWAKIMFQKFPPMNGVNALPDEIAFANEDSENHLTDYALGEHAAYCSFSTTVAEEASQYALSAADTCGLRLYIPGLGIVCETPVMVQALATDSGMWGLWDYSEYQNIDSYDEWEPLFCEDETILSQIAKEKFVPIYIHSDGCLQFQVQIDLPLNDREKKCLIAQSQPYLFSSSGKAVLSGIEAIGKNVSPQRGLLFDLPAGKYAVTVSMLNWHKETGTVQEDGKPAPNTLPDFIVSISSDAKEDMRYRQDVETFDDLLYDDMPDAERDPAESGNLNDAAANQDPAEVAARYLEKANRGDTEAMYLLAGSYEQGLGVARNDAEAFKWCWKAAEMGHAGAQFNMGVLYKRGNLVVQDFAEAAKWYRLAAEQGVAQAQDSLEHCEKVIAEQSEEQTGSDIRLGDGVIREPRADGDVAQMALALRDMVADRFGNRVSDFCLDEVCEVPGHPSFSLSLTAYGCLPVTASYSAGSVSFSVPAGDHPADTLKTSQDGSNWSDMEFDALLDDVEGELELRLTDRWLRARPWEESPAEQPTGRGMGGKDNLARALALRSALISGLDTAASDIRLLGWDGPQGSKFSVVFLAYGLWQVRANYDEGMFGLCVDFGKRGVAIGGRGWWDACDPDAVVGVLADSLELRTPDAWLSARSWENLPSGDEEAFGSGTQLWRQGVAPGTETDMRIDAGPARKELASYGLSDRDAFELIRGRALSDGLAAGKRIRLVEDPNSAACLGTTTRELWERMARATGISTLKKEGKTWLPIA